MKSRPRPNYFIGLRLKGDALYDAVRKIQDSICSRNENLRKIMNPCEKLHLTLVLIHASNLQLSLISSKLLECQELMKARLMSVASSASSLSFKQLNCFGSGNKRRVIWLDPEKDLMYDSILWFANELTNILKDIGVNAEATDIFHGTIANKNSKRVLIRTEDFEGLETHLVGVTSLIDEIDLLKIGAVDPTTGYYERIEGFSVGDQSCDL